MYCTFSDGKEFILIFAEESLNMSEFSQISAESIKVFHKVFILDGSSFYYSHI